MSAFQLTPEQDAAVKNRGGALLVSAAAGSGKTKVLVERLFCRVTDPVEPRNIDEFLVITYTKAAAAELRGKITDELTKRLATDPGNRHLQRQRLLVYKAQIATVHAFCSGLLREYSHVLDLNPDFRVSDEAESAVLRQRALTGVMNGRYESMEEADGFSLLVDTMSAGRDDKKLCEIVLDLYLNIQSHPYPDRWLDERASEFDLSGFTDAGQTPWGRLILDRARRQTAYWKSEMGAARKLISCYAALEKGYGKCFCEIEAQLDRMQNAFDAGWDAVAERSAIDFGRLGAVRGFEDKELQERVKQVRDRCKKRMGKLEKLFSSASAALFEDMAAVYPAVRALFALVGDFETAYAREKKRRGVVDFSDLEHLAVRLLADPQTGAPTALAGEISGRYCEIMVDEYQDTNQVQNLIFSAVSKKEENLFMVGDVKQSIYRFRQADPAIFLRKYRSFQNYGQATEGEPRKILLSKNFRSRDEVLAGVNFLFKNIMSTEFGEMEYTPAEYLYPGASYPEGEADAVELDILDMSAIERTETEESPRKAEVEARFIACRIRKLLDEPFRIFDSDMNRMRPVTEGDIVILMRSPSKKADVYTRALAEQDILCQADAGERFFDTVEISVMLSLLAIIDNPRQDVPLISVLRSPVYGFTADQLAKIHASAPAEDFYTALSAAEDENCKRFLDELDELRFAATDMSTERLIWHIYNKRNIPGIFGAMKGGRQRQSNLLMLFEHARRFESAGYQGLFTFINYVNRLRKNGEELYCPAQRGDSGSAVRIMSIHKSKGLEFPVVILADTAKKFNREDMKRPVLIHSKLGVGPKRLDMERMIEYPTLARQAVELKLTDEMMAEEERVLYVALTRAKEKLIITAAFRDAPATLKKLISASACPVDPQVLAETNSMAEWILLPVLSRPDAIVLRGAGGVSIETTGDDCGPEWDIRLIRGEDYLIPAAVSHHRFEGERDKPEEGERDKPEEGERLMEELVHNLSFVYPYSAETDLPSKLTATQLKGRFGDTEAEEDAPRRKRRQPFARPRFVMERKGLSPTERGTALHLVMQYIDFARTGSVDEIRAEISRIADMRLITGEQATAVRPEQIAAFFSSSLGLRIKNAKRLTREFKFSVLVPAKRFYPRAGEGEILLQGVVDCYMEDEDGLTVVDFKTDKVYPGGEAEKAAHYRAQLDAYASALTEVTGKPIKARVLYFFATGVSVEF